MLQVLNITTDNRCQSSMHKNIISIICVLIWTLTSADKYISNDYIPEVTKSIVEDTGSRFYPVLHRLGDSDTFMLNTGSHFHISFDNGEHWHTIIGLEGTGHKVTIDPFHQERAFISDVSMNIPEIHVTEDSGRSWRRFSRPKEVKQKESCTISTNPFDRNFLLLDCVVLYDEEGSCRSCVAGGNNIYVSDNGGRTFRNIVSSSRAATCQFAAVSKKSLLESNGIYCIQAQRKGHSLFYTTDLGETKKFFDELDDHSKKLIFVLPSSVAILTSDANGFFGKIWVSKGASFKLAHLPKNVVQIWYVEVSPGSDGQRLLLSASVKEKGQVKSEVLLISDTSGLSFSFWESTRQSQSLGQLGNLKGTLWRTYEVENNIEEKMNWLQGVLKVEWKEVTLSKTLNLLKDLFFKKSRPKITRHYATKLSVDNGKSWSNLKISDASGKYSHLFECRVEDVENCSFHFHPYYNTGEQSAAGIVIKTGRIGRNYTLPSKDCENCMTLISRDGGISWEPLFAFSAAIGLLDFGNIIIAIPKSDGTYTEFFFSLDQGRTWREYQFDEPIQAGDVVLRTRGLKAYIGFGLGTQRLKAHSLLDIFNETVLDEVNQESVKHVSYSIDFSSAFGGVTCTNDDWETWYLSNGTCIDGIKYSFDRRKPDAKCLMRKRFEKLELHEEQCQL